MIRASNIYNILTNRKNFNKEEYDIFLKDYKESLIKNHNISFNKEDIESYEGLKNMKMKTKSLKKYLKDYKEQFLLPDSVKNYLQELYLEKKGFYSPSVGEESIMFIKGKKYEEEAISYFSSYLKKPFVKNTLRKKEDFLTGECDIIFEDSIFDIKIPITFKSFKRKIDIPLNYYWQLLAYKYLYREFSIKNLYLVYILMPSDEEIIKKLYYNISVKEFHKILKTQNLIQNLPLKSRVKIFKLDNNLFEKDLSFMLFRLNKSKDYFNNLNIEKCMKSLL